MARDETQTGTAGRILDIAERLVQTRGFNAFSYADIASEMKVTKASLHYHFPTKAELGTHLIARYAARFAAALAAISHAAPSAAERLRGYAALYERVLHDGRMCLCGILAAEISTLPGPMQAELRQFFDANEAWLAEVLEHGRAGGGLRFAGPALGAARLMVGSLEGAMMLARSFGQPERFGAAAERLLGDLGVATVTGQGVTGKSMMTSD